MGSLRNPVGPLPSSIYWRRRTVTSVLVLLLVALVVWAVTRGGGGSGKSSSGPAGSHTPVGTITPGPTSSGPHISGQPGGRDTAPPDGSTSGDGGGSNSGAANGGTDAGTSAGDTAGTAGTAGDTTGTSAGDASNGGGTGGGSTGAASAGSGPGDDLVPVGSTLPACSPSAVTLTLNSQQRDYPVGGPAALQLRATNSGGVTCKLDFGPTSAVFTVTTTPSNDHVWASNDCGKASPYLMRVPAHGSTTYTLNWNARTSAPKCPSAKGTQAAAGNYLAQVALSGYPVKQATFTLSQD